jgi:hypothetical protein
LAKRSRESFGKRAREKARQEKQAEKREKRHSSSSSSDDGGVSRAEEDALMHEFAQLSERFEAGQISLDEFNVERERIFGELGLETG